MNGGGCAGRSERRAEDHAGLGAMGDELAGSVGDAAFGGGDAAADVDDVRFAAERAPMRG